MPHSRTVRLKHNCVRALGTVRVTAGHSSWSRRQSPTSSLTRRSSTSGTQPIERLFSSEKYCENPIRYPEGRGHQWQPNLGVVDGELWCLWNHGGSVHDFRNPDGTRRKDLRGLYFSRLKRADGKWVNRRLEWDGQVWPQVDGKYYYMNSTQNLYRLRSGRVLALVTLRGEGRGPTVEIDHRPEATWLYLGEGFPKYGHFPGTRFLIDIESVQTRVESKSP